MTAREALVPEPVAKNSDKFTPLEAQEETVNAEHNVLRPTRYKSPVARFRGQHGFKDK